ncbi:tripartite tricarboxylate transporter substrate binding protein [Comamonas thiooxydans]|uniref:Tripartite tricarboxylate transporter substrate binding protein n=1 Tax=Comamonas thiooxydans TaxID=363952 RepID=A0AA42Q3U7_9BURK|nr:tripartite tricarboxylate transporter substrate binding protein [Comamonas thiooxydans]MDH1336757.1 tripartite tricarboxylate transporter substrate binding protein [Comamonas thiooxydans]MDH1742837.1 tripartite tricarboxylate transporter substrate binding protein [Comamonas thiooxydans]MDH1789184.1 tripartite tricarboxylate transporter substrate binding protein [Comamonas thiooxydans]
MWNRRQLIAAGAASLAACVGVPAIAQNFPNRAVTMVVPFPAGGITDAVARALASKMGEQLGKPVIVDNRPGGGGQIAAAYVRQQAADGHTLYVGATEMFAINPSLFRNFSYDPLKDFTPVTSLIASPLVLVVPANSSLTSVKELIAQAKSRKDGLNFASQGMGSIGHLLGETFRGKVGGKFNHVAYKGSAPALQDVMGGQVDFMFDPVITTAPLVAGKKLKPLAIAADKRSPQMPEVPTLAELGVSGVNAGVWFGAVVKTGTTAVVVERLNDAIHQAMKDPEVVKRFADQGMQAFPSTPAQFGSFMQSELTKWGPLVKASGASIE